MIKVLWIDDECKNMYGELSVMGREFIEYAYEQEIDITPISTYKEGLIAIEAHPLEWCAVILDIREQRAATGNAVDGYQNAYDWLRDFHNKHSQEEPYIFTLSGEKRYHEEDSLIRKESYCSKRVYDKSGEDYKKLFDDIRKVEGISDLYKLHKKYTDLLCISKSLGENADNRLLEIMYSILIKKNVTDPKLLNEIRKYLEDFVIAFLKNKSFFSDKKKTLNECSQYIGDQEGIPEYIKRSFHSLVRIVQEGSHGKTTIDNDVRYGKAPYLLQSCLFELLNIIYWTKSI